MGKGAEYNVEPNAVTRPFVLKRDHVKTLPRRSAEDNGIDVICLLRFSRNTSRSTQTADQKHKAY